MAKKFTNALQEMRERNEQRTARINALFAKAIEQTAENRQRAIEAEADQAAINAAETIRQKYPEDAPAADYMQILRNIKG